MILPFFITDQTSDRSDFPCNEELQNIRLDERYVNRRLGCELHDKYGEVAKVADMSREISGERRKYFVARYGEAVRTYESAFLVFRDAEAVVQRTGRSIFSIDDMCEAYDLQYIGMNAKRLSKALAIIHSMYELAIPCFKLNRKRYIDLSFAWEPLPAKQECQSEFFDMSALELSRLLESNAKGGTK